MSFAVLLTESAKAELATIKHSGDKATIRKIANMLVELQELMADPLCLLAQ